MVDLITNVGEEYFYETNVDGNSHDALLYNDSSDTLGEGDNLSAISTEPTGASYARQSSTYSTRNNAGAFGIDNDNKLSFDTSDSSQSVDAGGLVANFQSDTVAGDGSANDNLIAAGDLSQTRDLSNIDTTDIPAGDLNVENM